MFDNIQNTVDNELLDKLFLLRSELANGKPRYVVATDNTLILLATKKPLTKKSFCDIYGLGDKKYDKFGKEIISVIKNHLYEQGINVDDLESEEIKRNMLKENSVKQTKMSNNNFNRKATSKILTPIKKSSYKNTYKYRLDMYPGYIVVKKEGCFWEIRGDDVYIIQDLLGYRVSNNEKLGLLTGGPKLEKITNALENNKYNFVVIENERCIYKASF